MEDGWTFVCLEFSEIPIYFSLERLHTGVTGVWFRPRTGKYSIRDDARHESPERLEVSMCLMIEPWWLGWSCVSPVSVVVTECGLP